VVRSLGDGCGVGNHRRRGGLAGDSLGSYADDDDDVFYCSFRNKT
jgi:hypothetical protein